jgi:methylated-DNA-[protein]-cysteine S-methyltransferase
MILESMSKFVLTLLQQDGLHVAGVFTARGLYATSLPRNSKDAAIEAVDGFDLPITENAKHLQVLKLVFDICNGKKNVAVKSVPLDFSDLTQKQVAVLHATMKIPYGSTWSYGLVAQQAGMPRAARFVGNVMAKNRFAPIVPCHRVVSSNGLGGYTGGLDFKISLLSKERAFAD